MLEWWQALVLGLIEGLTEFIPVSSTGHLVIAGEALHAGSMASETTRSAFQNGFDVFIQFGAILAVMAAFPGRIAGLVPRRGPAQEGFRGWRGLGLILLASAPALVVAYVLVAILELETWLLRPVPVALALIAGAVWMLGADRKDPGGVPVGVRRRPAAVTDLDHMTWRHALRIGLFQCLAIWPGMSRSVTTILGGMHCGLDRRTAAEFSFFVAIPVLGAAGAYALVSVWGDLSREGAGLMALGFAMAMATAWLTVRWLVRYVSRHTLHLFAWYRLALAAVVLASAWAGR